MELPAWWKDVHFRSLVLVCLAAIMERADEALLPSVYREIGVALHASPAALGSLTLVRSLTQALLAPLAGFLAQRYNRASIIAAGALMWAIATFFVGISSTFSQVAISRAMNGVGLAVVGPSIQSMIADGVEESKRGEAFGWFGVAGNMGSILGGLFAVLMADKTILGIDGWRMAFHLVALLSVLIGAVVYQYAVDPVFSSSLVPRKETSFLDSVREIYLDTKSVIKIKSFQIFVAQGIAGSFPWAALAFAPMWLELIGFSNEVTAVLMGCFVVATSFGSLFGGMMGDYLSLRLPNSGRIILSQISPLSGVPLGAVLLLALPSDPSTPFLHGFIFFIMGFTLSWNGAATNGPIFAEIVPEKSRTNVYALDRAFETVLSSFAPPIVGLLAEHVYGYVPPADDPDNLSIDRENAVALADALYTSIAIPFILCAAIYSGLYWTYPKDRDRVRALQMDPEMVPSVPLEEMGSKEQYIWNVAEVEEDQDDERKIDEERKQIVGDIGDGVSESETIQMIPKH